MKTFFIVSLFFISQAISHVTHADGATAAQEVPTVDGAKQMADEAKKKDSGAGGANIAAAMALLPACMAKPPNPMACAMMAMALMQAGKDKQNAGDAGLTSFSAAPVGGFDDDEFNSSSLGSEAENAGRGGSGLTAGEERLLDDAKGVLADNGFSIDSAGQVSGPDGAIPSSAFSSPSGLAEFGFSSDDIAGAETGLSAAKKAAAAYKSQDVAASGGGGGARAPGASNFELPPLDDNLFALQDHSTSLKNQVKGSRYAGFSRQLAGDRIGVAGDDIFNMVKRRYSAKRKANFFLP